jgi:hypothetical protein
VQLIGLQPGATYPCRPCRPCRHPARHAHALLPYYLPPIADDGISLEQQLTVAAAYVSVTDTGYSGTSEYNAGGKIVETCP